MAASRGAPSLGWTCGVARGPHARLLCGAPRGARRGVGHRTWGVEGRGAHQAPHVGEPAVVAKPREHLGRTVALAAAHLLERRAHDRAARVEIVRMRQPKVAQLAPKHAGGRASARTGSHPQSRGVSQPCRAPRQHASPRARPEGGAAHVLAPLSSTFSSLRSRCTTPCSWR